MRSWLNLLPPMLRIPSTSASDSVNDIRDELMFHFRQLVCERIAQGASFDEAWELAEQQFGPLRQIEIQCQKVAGQNRFAWSMLAVTAACLVLVGCWGTMLNSRHSTLRDSLTRIEQNLAAGESARQAFETQVMTNWQVSERRFDSLQSQFELTGQKTQPLNNPSIPWPDEVRTVDVIRSETRELADLTGQVLDGRDEPIAEAKILVVLKTWPSGRYQQDDFFAETDDDGTFILPKLVPTAGRYAVQVTVVKEGYALQSHYNLKTRPDESLRPVDFRLEPTTPKTLVLQDEMGQPIRQVNVIPSTRITSQGDEFHVYFQGSESIQVTSDANGRVELASFSTGDRAELYFQLPGEPWKTQQVDISGEEIVVQLPGRHAPL